MSTRATYEFRDKYDRFTVYKHHDGYPRGAAEFISEAMTKAWLLPRFEASDFAAAFIAANKTNGGGVYMSKGRKAHGDTAFHYIITYNERTGINVKALERLYDEREDGWQTIYNGDLAGLSRK